MQRNQSQLKKLPLHRNQNHCLFKHLRRVKYIISPNGTLHYNRNRSLPQHHLTELWTTWSMSQASVGWRVRAPTTAHMRQICTRTATKSEAWDKRKAVRYQVYARYRTAYSVSFSSASLNISWTRISEMTSQTNRSARSFSSIHVVWGGI